MLFYKLKIYRGFVKNVMYCLELGLYYFVFDYRLLDISVVFFFINKY